MTHFPMRSLLAAAVALGLGGASLSPAHAASCADVLNSAWFKSAISR